MELQEKSYVYILYDAFCDVYDWNDIFCCDCNVWTMN